jgi:hypothetical protein
LVNKNFHSVSFERPLRATAIPPQSLRAKALAPRGFGHTPKLQ